MHMHLGLRGMCKVLLSVYSEYTYADCFTYHVFSTSCLHWLVSCHAWMCTRGENSQEGT